MKKEYYFIIAIVVFAGIVFGFGSQAGLALQALLRRGVPGPGVDAYYDPTQLTAFVGASLAGRQDEVSGLKVKVYSQYPLNIKNQLSISSGMEDGVEIGDVALVDSYLTGVVEKTSKGSALVQTVFDKRFQIPVRIGTSGTNALLRGGNDPELTLIPLNAEVGENDQIYAAAEGMPYGAPIGFLRNLHDSADRIFKEANVFVPYNPADLEEITIISSPGR